jgi:hypothetical protein
VEAHGHTAGAGYHAGMFWSSLGSAGGLLWSTITHPTFDLASMPPIIIAGGSLIAAYWSGRKMQEDIRHSREMHQLEVEAKKVVIAFEAERTRILLSQVPPIGSKEFREQFFNPPSISTAQPAEDKPSRPTPDHAEPQCQAPEVVVAGPEDDLAGFA